MEQISSELPFFTALLVECVAVAGVVFGAAEAFLRLFLPFLIDRPAIPAGHRHRQTLHFTSFEDLGRLAAITAIHTFLNLFFENDSEEARPQRGRERIEA